MRVPRPGRNAGPGRGAGAGRRAGAGGGVGQDRGVGPRGGAVGPLLGLYAVAALFRSAQNVAQTSLAPIGEGDLHLRAAAIGVVLALGGVAGVGSTVLLGRRAVETTVLRWMAVGLALTAGSYLVLAAAGSPWLLALAAVMLGAGGGLIMPSLTTLVGRNPTATAPRRLAGMTVALSASLTVGPVADSALIGATSGSVRAAVAIFAVLPVLGIVLVITGGTRPARPAGSGPAPGSPTGPTDARRGPSPAGPAAPIPAAPTPAAPNLATTASRPVLAVSPWKRPGWRLATVGQLLYQVPFMAVIGFGVVAAGHLYGLAPAVAQLGISAFFAVSFSVRVVLSAGWVTIRRPKRALLLVAALSVAGVALLGLGRTEVSMFVALGLLGLPHGLVYPVALAIIAEETPPERLAHANATFSAFTAAATVVLPLVLGGLATLGGYRVMFLALLAPVVILAALVASWPAPRPPTSEERQVLW